MLGFARRSVTLHKMDTGTVSLPDIHNPQRLVPRSSGKKGLVPSNISENPSIIIVFSDRRVE